MILGIDEAGRGNLCGNIYAGACIIPEEIPNFEWLNEITDSKALNETKRFQLVELIKQHLYWGIGHCTPEEIDLINILQADFVAMRRAVIDLKTRFPHVNLKSVKVIVDGNQLPDFNGLVSSIQMQWMIKADSKVREVGAASILAKTAVDSDMIKYDLEFPGYDLIHNKGYGTKKFIQSLREKGPLPIMRKSFKVKEL
jgi:ribonuclease HII